MAIRIALHHKTSYRYDRPVSLSPHEVRLRPAPHARTPILSYSLTGNRILTAITSAASSSRKSPTPWSSRSIWWRT
jgi:transglutaminase-like putative cysteine protease